MLDRIKSNVSSIGEVLYSKYKLLFKFDNVISHAVYTKNILQVIYINKEPRG